MSKDLETSVSIIEVNRGFTKIKAKIRDLELKAIKSHKLDISEKEWNYLVWFAENPNKTITELAEILAIGKGTLSNNLKVLIRKKLLTKRAATDKRYIQLETTEKGRRYIEIHKKEHEKIKTLLLKILTKHEYEDLVVIGRKLQKDL